MHISELKESKFLKKEEVDPAMLVTISEVTQENIAKEGAPQELKWCVHFNELEKPMVLNSTNGQLIAMITGSEDSEGWTGAQVVLYHDPSVTFGGKLVGGIRIRAPKNKAKPKPMSKQVQPDEVDDDGVPF